jgi:regulator of replication initiation timing
MYTVRDNRGAQDEFRELRDRLEVLLTENARLHSENRDLQAALDAHVARARSANLFGPVEMTAGTCAGARRRRG